MRTRAMAMAALLLGSMGMSACMPVAGECFHPITTAIPAGIVPLPAPEGVAPALGQCGKWVKYDGRQYTVESSRPDNWSLTESDLTPIGHATSATDAAGRFADDMVYAIDGVRPLDVIAMHAASPPGEIVVLRSGTELPERLCRNLETPPADASPCASLLVSPTPTGT